MARNNFQIHGHNEMDELINQAFLNLDFENPANQRLIEAVSEKTFGVSGFFSSINKIVVGKLILVVSAFVLVDSLNVYLNYKEEAPLKITETLIVSKKIDQSSIHTPGPSILPATTKPLNFPEPGNKKSQESIQSAVNDHFTLSGSVHSAKTGEALKGVVIYRLNSAASTTSGDDGRFSIYLPKGENSIGAVLIGYQTYTLSVSSDEDISMHVELKEEWKALEEVTVKNDEYIFPVLTDKEQKANEREKQKMAKLAARLKTVRERHDDKYPFIPASPDGSIQSFNMGGYEVTNLEYRTFLFDLLINGKKQEFLQAKPEQHLWINAGGRTEFDTLSGVYFSEKRYNQFPVVNISVTGAKMYCAWLTEQANLVRQRENAPEIQVRLPNEREWYYAASAGNNGAVYPWLRDSVQNHVNWFLANCCIQKQIDKLKQPLGHKKRSDLTAYTSAGMVLGNRQLATIEVYAYNPNDFYLYCTSGNAAEMVYSESAKAWKAKGGSWNSDCEHVKLNAPDEFNAVSPSPMIGFRVCIDQKK